MCLFHIYDIPDEELVDDIWSGDDEVVRRQEEILADGGILFACIFLWQPDNKQLF